MVRYYRFNNGRKDTSHYIEERTNKLNRKYYFEVEDYSIINKGIFRRRIRKYIAEYYINSKRFIE